MADADFGAGPTHIQPRTQVIDLRPGQDGPLPATGPIDWSALDDLPNLLTITWSGPDRGISEAVTARPGIRFLYWHDAVGDIDLSRSALNTVSFEGPGVTSARLPESLETLMLTRPSPDLTVDAPDMGARMDLRLFQYGPDVVIPPGMRATPELWLRVGGTVSATVLDGMTDLRKLTLDFDKPPGTLDDQAALARHPLRWLQLCDGYGWRHEDLPELPSLRDLILYGTRRTTSAAVKAKFKGSVVDVEVDGAKSEDWIAKHIDNPFFDWVDDGKAFGEAACKAYSKALTALSADPESALRGLVADLSAINDKYGLIDTMNRDHAWEVFAELAQRAGVASERADAWFDDGRRF